MCTIPIKAKPDKPSMEKRVGHKIQRVIKEPMATVSCWRREDQFFIIVLQYVNHTPESHHLGIFGQQKLATMGKNGYRIGWEGRSGKSGKS